MIAADRLVRSTDLTGGDFNSRTYLSMSLAPVWKWALGSGAELEVRAGRFHMQPGDLLFLYTDGLNEAFSASKEQFGTKRLDAVLMKNHKEPEKLLEAISTEVHHHVNHNKLQDDLCMVAIRYGGDANN